MIAGALGVLVLVLALLAARKRRHGVLQVAAAAVLVALAIGLYMRGQHVAASALAIAGEAILLFAALRWSNVDLSRTARSEEHTSELQSLMRTSYAVFCLKNKKRNKYNNH